MLMKARNELEASWLEQFSQASRNFQKIPTRQFFVQLVGSEDVAICRKNCSQILKRYLAVKSSTKGSQGAEWRRNEDLCKTIHRFISPEVLKTQRAKIYAARHQERHPQKVIRIEEGTYSALKAAADRFEIKVSELVGELAERYLIEIQASHFQQVRLQAEKNRRRELGLEINDEIKIPPIPITETVKVDGIVCLEDLRKIKDLRRYIKRNYNMSAKQYKEKWGLPADYPMYVR